MADVTWWGHATCTIEDRGVPVLTDPLFCSRLGHLRRRRGPLPGSRSRRADLAVVSHLHADHLDLDPARAAAFLAELDAYHAIPVHFGTMWPIGLEPVRPHRFHRPGAEFVGQVARLGLACSVRELWPGETARFDLPDKCER